MKKMAKFHLNPAKGPMRCSAAEGQCPYGSDAPHFASKQEAQAAYEERLEAETKPLESLRKEGGGPRPFKSPTPFTPELVELDEKLEEADFEAVAEFANSTPENHELLNKLIEARAANSPERYRALQELNPSTNPESALTKKSFNLLNKEWQAYRNQTALLVEAHTESKFYKSQCVELPQGEPVGLAREVTAYAHDDPQWHLTRYNTVGGSDVGALVLRDFAPEGSLTGWDRGYIKKVQESKITPPTVEAAKKSIYNSEESRAGALYRGTVWEDRIRDGFAGDHPEFKVYHTKSQYVREGREWQRVNFDGLLSDRADGEPNGVLEIKTGGEPEKWADGIPTAYRAQALYYLNATGFKYGVVRLLMNDGEARDYTIHADDEVYPGCGVPMESYVEESVTSWMEEMRALRPQEPPAA